MNAESRANHRACAESAMEMFVKATERAEKAERKLAAMTAKRDKALAALRGMVEEAKEIADTEGRVYEPAEWLESFFAELEGE